MNEGDATTERDWYRNTYHQLVKAEHVDQLWQLLKQTGLCETYSLAKMSLANDEGGFPYLTCEQSQGHRWSESRLAMQLSVFMDVRSVLPSYDREDYYLPFVVLPASFDQRLAGPYEMVIRHEVLHIKDLLGLVVRDPDYLARARKFALTNLDDAGHLAESIDLAVFQQFHFEKRALCMEYREGDKILRFPVLGLVVLYTCASEHEYVELFLSLNFTELTKLYKDRFPSHEAEIAAGFDRALAKYSQRTYGERVRLKDLQDRYANFVDQVPRLIRGDPRCQVIVPTWEDGAILPPAARELFATLAAWTLDLDETFLTRPNHEHMRLALRAARSDDVSPAVEPAETLQPHSRKGV